MIDRALYSLIQFTTITLLYSFASSLGNFQVRTCLTFRQLCTEGLEKFLYIDLFIIIPVAVSSKSHENSRYSGWSSNFRIVGRTLPYPWIDPKRPTANLVSRSVLASIVGQIIITGAAQFWVFFWVRRQPWYVEAGRLEEV
jgi:cation-transporting ATPase 13A2